MPKQAFDDEFIPIRAELGGGPAATKVKTVNFTVTLDKGGVQDVKPPNSVPVVDGFPRSATHKFKEAVPDDLDFYQLSYTAAIAAPSGAEIRDEGFEPIQVWASQIEIQFTSDVADHKKLVKFQLKNAGRVVGAGTAFDTGAWKGRGPRQAYTVEVQAPWVIEATTRGTGRKREYKVKKVSDRAVIKSPTEPDKDVHQVVNCTIGNLDYDNTRSEKWTRDKPYGKVLEVIVEPEHGKLKARPDDLVYITCTFGRQSARNDPAATPGLLADGGVANIVKTNSDKTQTGEVKLVADKDRLVAKFKVQLGLAGGDTCEIKVGMTAACDDGPNSRVKIENWRLIWYQLGKPTTLNANLKDAVKALHNVKVEYRQSDLNEMDEPTVADYTTWYPANLLMDGGTGNFLVVGDHNIDDVQDTFDNALRDRESRIIFCDMQFDGDTTNETWQGEIPADYGDTVEFNPLESVDPDDTPALLKYSVKDGAFAVTAQWKSATGAWTDIPEANIVIDYPNSPDQVKITLPPEATAANVGQPIELKTVSQWAQGPYLGWAVNDAHTVIIALRDPDEREVKEWNKTIVHEVGHMMRMVLDVTAPGLDITTHGRQYDARGGSGSHCAEGVSQADFDSGADIDPGQGATCVMYAIGVEQCKIDFCARCKPFVLGEDLTTIA